MQQHHHTTALPRLLEFTSERFPLQSHLPMVASFVLGNMALAAHVGKVDISPHLAALNLLLALSFFFRLRCFDELKDHQVDLRVNPSRPLARGLVTRRELKLCIGFLSVFELGASGAVYGTNPFYLVAMAYSFLMYKEFFIGRYLRPHLTTYALTHTLVSVFLAYGLMAETGAYSLSSMPRHLLLLGIMNWFLFNLFEFARKSFAPSEERPQVESYSSLFKPMGAGLLSLSQVLLALCCLSWAGFDGMAVQAFFAACVTCAALFYALSTSKGAANLFRMTSSAYLLIFYIVLAWQTAG